MSSKWDNIGQIMDRYQSRIGRKFKRITLAMDLDFSKVDLEALLESDDMTFMHDVTGIQQNMDRSTGQLGNCFVPRVGFREE
jgi:hypothetical protein